MRYLFNISFYYHVKTHSSVFYLQQIVQSAQAQNIASPHCFYYHSHPYLHYGVLNFFLISIFYNSYLQPHPFTFAQQILISFGSKGNIARDWGQIPSLKGHEQWERQA